MTLQATHGSFFIGLRNGLFLSLPVWAAIAWIAS